MERIDDGADSREKRFQIPGNEVLRERLKGIQQVVKQMQRNCPEILSFSMYGSMVKDTATLESDIDGTLFVDTTPTGDAVYDAHIEEGIRTGRYLDKFKQELIDQLKLTPEQVGKDVTLESLSEVEVSKAAGEYAQAFELYKHEKSAWEASRRDTGEVKPGAYGGEVPVYAYDGEEPHSPELPGFIGPMFNLDVGGGLRPYRQKFLASLEQLTPEQVESICVNISAHISFSEGGKRKIHTNFPRTFEDLKRVYM